MDNSDLLDKLLDGSRLSLANWFAQPLAPDVAWGWLQRIREAMGTGRGALQATANVRVAGIILRFWTGHDIEPGYRSSLALCENDRERALLELCCGQLMIARRIDSAWKHLDRGFELAARLLEAEEYFRVLKRHELLRQLPLAPAASQGAPLDDLLDEARVIARLRGPRHAVPVKLPRHRDTLD